MELLRRLRLISLGLIFIASLLLMTRATASSALEFEIDSTTSTFQSVGGLIGPQPPEALSGSIVIDVDLDANTATFVSISASPTIMGIGLDSDLLSLLNVAVPIVSNRAVLGDLFTRFDFLFGVDSVDFQIELGNALVDGPRILLNGTASIVPEPTTVLLIGLGLSGLAAKRRSS